MAMVPSSVRLSASPVMFQTEPSDCHSPDRVDAGHVLAGHGHEGFGRARGGPVDELVVRLLDLANPFGDLVGKATVVLVCLTVCSILRCGSSARSIEVKLARWLCGACTYSWLCVPVRIAADCIN